MLKYFACLICGLSIVLSCAAFSDEGENDEPVVQEESALRFKMNTLAGKEVDLASYEGKVVMIVNVASKCGRTPQYEQLQELHEEYAKEGLAILGFPCNQFGKQEPGTPEEIQEFCELNYGVEFDLFAKIEVNGDDACPLYQLLTSIESEPLETGDVGWNFEKFILDRNGFLVARFGSRVKPDEDDVLAVLERELAVEVEESEEE
jgi:glutathione peroxidase